MNESVLYKYTIHFSFYKKFILLIILYYVYIVILLTRLLTDYYSLYLQQQ